MRQLVAHGLVTERQGHPGSELGGILRRRETAVGDEACGIGQTSADETELRKSIQETVAEHLIIAREIQARRDV